MENRKYKKGLVLGIFILFVISAIVPNINGSTGKTSIHTTKQIPTNFLLNNGYLDSFWKFDTGSGSTAYDSSGHHYDGIINGASWTAGKINSALNFDGVNDYVNLDSHAKKLGFNKTDDIIFSCYFKSSSTESGMIYCLAGYEHVPEARIELLANGTIAFKVWTNVCGILLFSENTFNDDSWHFLEIYFNGITANPTTEIYIDGDLEGSLTCWLCDIENDDFSRAKIGRRGYEDEGYFNGKIDELKVIKYPGGNEQGIPIIDGPESGEPDVEYDFTFVTNDPEDDEIYLHIMWGDGTETKWLGPYDSGEEVVVSHEYNEEGEFEIKAESKDYWDDSYEGKHTIKIGNQPPGRPTITGPQFGDPGVSYEYTLIANDPEGHYVFYYVDWGDGTHDDWFGPYPSGQEVKADHAWNTEGEYEITAKAKDERGNEGKWSYVYPIRIGDEPPSAPDIVGPSGGTAGRPHTYTFTSTDPEDDQVSYHIKWGDGTETDWTPFRPSGDSFSVSHTWDKKGTYNIEAKAKDTYGAESNVAILTVTMPRAKTLNTPFLDFLRNHPNLFPIIRQLLGL